MEINIKALFKSDYNIKKGLENGKNKQKNNQVLKIRNFNFIIIIISIIFISFIKCKSPFIRLYCDSKITIIINKKGQQKIINDKYSSFLSKVEINSSDQKEVKNSYKLNDNINTIIMTFGGGITACDNMFANLGNITNIDLSEFNNNKITTMENMFLNCKGVTSINFGNLLTSSVTNMKSMFQDCTMINTLNLQKFDTTQVTTMESMFNNCYSLKELDLSKFKTSLLKTMKFMFYSCSNLNSLKFSPNLDTSKVTDMSHLFRYCKKLSSIDLSKFDTSSVVSMEYMFCNCENINSFDLSSFNTTKVENMGHMFDSCLKIISLDLSNFDTFLVTNMEYIFSNCKQIKNLNFIIINEAERTSKIKAKCWFSNIFTPSNYDKCVEELTTTKIYNFDTSNVKNMQYMFSSCSSLESFDFSHFNTSLVENMKYTFSDCSNLTSINFQNIHTSKVISMEGLFKDCKNIKNIDFSLFKTDSLKSVSKIFENSNCKEFVNIKNFDISRVEDISYMFSSCKEVSSIDLSNLNIKSVKKMDYLFNDCTDLISFKFTKSDTANVISINGLFKGCTSLSNVDLSDMKTPSLISINHIFENCHNLKSVNFKNFDISKVTDLSYMFNSCTNLISIDLNILNTTSVAKMNHIFNNCQNLESININYLDTSKVDDMSYMFSSCIKLSSLDLSNINTISVKNMNFTFSSCNNLVSLNITNFYTKNVRDMSYMFNDCFNLSNLEISHFDSFSAVDMNYMFGNCHKLKLINITNFGINSLVNLEYMFNGCEELISLELTTPNINKVKYLKYMFSGCKNLRSIDISHFDTSNVENMENIFNECNSLVSLNLSNFETSKVTKMANLFNNCFNLTFIDINNFNTSLVEDMQNMFSGCESLTFLNLSNFETSKVTNMKNMFSNCKNLNSIYLSHFNTSIVTNMQNMFAGSEKLLILNIINFDFSSVIDISGMFQNCKSLIYLNVGQKSINHDFKYNNIFDNNPNDTEYCFEILNHNIFSNYNFTSNCSHTCFQKDSSIIFEKRNCIKKCEYDEDYKFEYNKICRKACPNGTHCTYGDEFLCEEDIECPEFNINNTKCDEDAKYGYYLDKNDGIYRACYKFCKKCYGPGNIENNNCLECIENMKFIDEPFKPKNCFPKCNNYYFIDGDQNYFCTNASECPLDYPKLVFEKEKCIEKCKSDNKYNFEYNNRCFLFCPNGTIYRSNKKICYDIESISTDEAKADIAAKEEKISSFKEDLMNGDMDEILKNITENGEDFVQDEDGMTLQLTTSENQKNNSNKNISTIDLGECEKELKRVYKINESLPLIILKIDYYTKDTLIPIIGYEIYHPIEKYKLNLSYCEEILIKLNIPVNIEEDKLFKYDPNSEYYTDDCSSYTTDDGTDIILNDRKIEFGDNNLSLCENNCKYGGYNPENKQSICDCGIKNEMEYISDIVDNQNKLSNQFETNTSSSNIISIKCTKTLFTKDGLKNNISSYVLLFIIFYFLLSIVLFIKCGYPLLVMEINKIIKSKEKKSNKRNKRRKTYNKNLRKKNLNTSISMPPYRGTIRRRIEKPVQKRYYRQKRSDFNLWLGIAPKTIIIKNNDNYDRKEKSESINQLNRINMVNLDKKEEKKKEMINYNFNDYELNTLSYNDAIRYDHRTCFQYYICLIKMKQPIIFGFCPFKDYNTIIIKSCIFFLSFAIYYAMNFVFFTEDTIHKIYEDGGKYDLVFFIPQICIAFAISHVITVIVKLIFLSQRNIATINIQKPGNSLYDVTEKEKKNLVIKYSFFFILGIIFLGIFWLFLSAFGAVYQNTQIIVFENTLISFAISLVYPFFINLLPCAFRMCSLSDKKQGLSFIYNISKFFQLL